MNEENRKDKKELSVEVGLVIKKHRLAASLTQEELAFRAGLNPVYYGEVERGVKCPSLDTIYKIAYALDVPPLVLLLTQNFEKDMELYRTRLSIIIDTVPIEKREEFLKVITNISKLL